MRIGLITCHRSWNYGANLQAYALCKVLQDMGHEVQFIDYHRGAIDSVGQHFSKRRPWTLIVALIRQRKLSQFRRQHIPRTPSYLSDADLEAHPPVFDAYICGSDQIWNPCLHGRMFRAYFLHFVRDGAGRRIAYAPSFGEFRPGSAHDEEMARLIARFHALSAREEEGVEIIGALTGRTAEHVLDPTLLIDDYSSVSLTPNHRDDYIATYMLGQSIDRTRLVMMAREHFGLPVVSVGEAHLVGTDKAVPVGVEEWLGYIQNAKFVCTDSFHGTALSILFRKDFLTIRHPTRNARIAGLLRRLGLLHRQVSDSDAAAPCDQLREPVAYHQAHVDLQTLRHASLDYLQRALTGWTAAHTDTAHSDA